jgi:hypothetical protein
MNRMYERQATLRDVLIQKRFSGTQGAPQPPDGVENIGSSRR